MFFEPKNADHGLAQNPFNSLILPRPIGWITTVDKDGNVNCAPYSFFNAVSYRPPTVMISAAYSNQENDAMKDTQRNIEETGEFVHNVSTWDTREAMNITSGAFGKDVDELEKAGLTTVPSKLVKAPRIAQSPVQLECKLVGSYVVPHVNPEDKYTILFGEVVGMHIDESVITSDGLIDVGKLQPLGRLGYQDYASIGAEQIFAMDRPKI